MSRVASKPEPATIAWIARRAGGRGLARCGHCEAALTIVMVDYAPAFIDPRGFWFDYANNHVGCRTGVWRPTAHHRNQRQRLRQLIAAGHGTAADRARLDRGDFGGQQSDAEHRYDPVFFRDEAGVFLADRAVFGKYLLPVRIECPESLCGSENLVVIGGGRNEDT